jgi:hypothetical protein
MSIVLNAQSFTRFCEACTLVFIYDSKWIAGVARIATHHNYLHIHFFGNKVPIHVPRMS